MVAKTTGDSRFEFPARMDSLPLAAAFVESFCDAHGVARADGLRLTLVLEELFTNTVGHGHRGDSAAPVRIGLRAEPTRLVLSYEDGAPAFDPLAYIAQADVLADDEFRDEPARSMGLRLVVKMAASVSYRREDGLNRLQLVLLRQA